MSNKLNRYKKSYILLFWWHDQYKKSWSKKTRARQKVVQKYSYLLHWTSMMIKFNSDDDLTLKKTLELYSNINSC